ncbi:MAG: hypothetical protein KUL75_08320 [Sterolibacterium sp.]|nr:hypothetical protein [Sterolibacterium sp.]
MSQLAMTEVPMPQALRQDLRLYESAPGADGGPSWAIQDPASNRFFRIGWLEYECLLRWPGRPEAIAADIEAATPLAVDAEQVAEFARFLEVHQLALPSAETRQRIKKQAREPGWRHWRWWLHNYLFFRIPLLRPQRFLNRLTPLLAPLFTPAALFLFVAATLLGLVLVARQWEQFTHSVLDSLTLTGLLGFLLALVISKSLHELGHAVVATRFGVRVAHMGIAFLVLWPMLYTDTGESWRLRSHRQRLAISLAGITVELGLAALATLAWVLLDDGALRQAALYLATTGWLLSLTLNASPFMRFDGYFILSDLLDFPNLHERAGALARVWLRRQLLGLADPWPEELSQNNRRMLIAFAFMTWIYRLVVFLGIALMVYFLFFKALGIFLMLVELVWFIARPIWSEMSVWKKRWPEVRMRRQRLIHGVLAGVFLLLLLPWPYRVASHGYVHAERQQLVFAPFPAELVELRQAGAVGSGETLVVFTTPDLLARQTHVEASTAALTRRLAGLLELDGGMNKQLALTQQLDEQHAELRGLVEEAGRLAIHAEFAGQWRDPSVLLRPGTWLGVREAVGILIDPQSWVVDAYVEQRLVDRIAPGAQASFLPQNSLRALAGTVLEVDTVRSPRLPHTMLDSRHGGYFNTLPDGREATPSEALYRVRIRLHDVPDEIREMRGNVHIAGQPRSLLWEGVKGALATLIRESGF